MAEKERKQSLLESPEFREELLKFIVELSSGLKILKTFIEKSSSLRVSDTFLALPGGSSAQSQDQRIESDSLRELVVDLSSCRGAGSDVSVGTSGPSSSKLGDIPTIVAEDLVCPPSTLTVTHDNPLTEIDVAQSASFLPDEPADVLSSLFDELTQYNDVLLMPWHKEAIVAEARKYFKPGENMALLTHENASKITPDRCFLRWVRWVHKEMSNEFEGCVMLTQSRWCWQMDRCRALDKIPGGHYNCVLCNGCVHLYWCSCQTTNRSTMEGWCAHLHPRSFLGQKRHRDFNLPGIQEHMVLLVEKEGLFALKRFHRRAQTIPDNGIGSVWMRYDKTYKRTHLRGEILLTHPSGETFVVKRKLSGPCDQCEKYKHCRVCDICYHTFQCSCDKEQRNRKKKKHLHMLYKRRYSRHHPKEKELVAKYTGVICEHRHRFAMFVAKGLHPPKDEGVEDLMEKAFEVYEDCSDEEDNGDHERGITVRRGRFEKKTMTYGNAPCWYCRSVTRNDVHYMIVEQEEPTECSTCSMDSAKEKKCTECDINCHRYRCNCDFVSAEGSGICKHVHALVMMLNEDRSSMTNLLIREARTRVGVAKEVVDNAAAASASAATFGDDGGGGGDDGDAAAAAASEEKFDALEKKKDADDSAPEHSRSMFSTIFRKSVRKIIPKSKSTRRAEGLDIISSHSDAASSKSESRSTHQANK